jgi:hypothetical protein
MSVLGVMEEAVTEWLVRGVSARLELMLNGDGERLGSVVVIDLLLHERLVPPVGMRSWCVFTNGFLNNVYKF